MGTTDQRRKMRVVRKRCIRMSVLFPKTVERQNVVCCSGATVRFVTVWSRDTSNEADQAQEDRRCYHPRCHSQWMQSCWQQRGIQEKESQSRQYVCRVWITRQICVFGFGSLGEKTQLKFSFLRFLEWIVMANNCNRRWHLTPQEENVFFYGHSYPEKTKDKGKIMEKS